MVRPLLQGGDCRVTFQKAHGIIREIRLTASYKSMGMALASSVSHYKIRTSVFIELRKTRPFGSSIANSTLGDLPMHKLVLAICLLSVTASFAAAQNLGSGGQKIKNPPKPHGHAPEMSTNVMAIAGIIGIGGYLVLRRRLSFQN